VTLGTSPENDRATLSSSPRRLYRLLARAEVVTWALLLAGMALKYSGVTEVGVRVFGMAHGVVFIAYCLVTGLLWVDQRWSFGRFVLGLLSAVLPFFTVPFEAWAERRGMLGERWRLRAEEPRAVLERLTAFVVRRPARGAALGLVAVAGLTGVALLVGPPA
jgi:integral membrane protein